MQKKGENMYFIGCFPPPYGGVTVKNNIFFEALSQRKKIDKFETNRLKNSPLEYGRLCLFLFRHRKNNGLISIAGPSLMKFTKLLFSLDKSMLSRISLLVVGGRLDFYIKNRSDKTGLFGQFKNIYVETRVLEKKLKKRGLTNVFFLPNVRPLNHFRRVFNPCKEEVFRCVFMSKICREKGVDEIIKAAHDLDLRRFAFQIDFYGPIDPIYEGDFRKELALNKNLRYCGVLPAESEKVYDTLRKFHVLLFPTKHPGEGMPGILVEAKMSGIPVIASDWKYNSEMIHHMHDGILLPQNTPESLRDTILLLSKDTMLQQRLAENSALSAQEYDIEKYLPIILKRM